MSQKTVYYCDWCNKELDKLRERYAVYRCIMSNYNLSNRDDVLCINCSKKLDKLIKYCKDKRID